MLEVTLSGSLQAAANGESQIAIQADTIRELIRKIVERYPRMQTQVDDGVSVSINGQIFNDEWNKSIPPDAEVFLLPKIQGG